jgi:hypothetical protein
LIEMPAPTSRCSRVFSLFFLGFFVVLFPIFE